MLCKSAMGSQTKDNFMYENGYGSQRNRVGIMPKSTSPISGWNGKGNESPKRGGEAKEECVKENFFVKFFFV